MVWMLPVGMAALGYLQGEKKRKQELAMAMGNAEANRYSPWTGTHNRIEAPSGDGMMGAMQGGLTGAMMMQSMGKSGWGDAAPSEASSAGAKNPNEMYGIDWSDPKDPNDHLRTGYNERVYHGMRS